MIDGFCFDVWVRGLGAGSGKVADPGPPGGARPARRPVGSSESSDSVTESVTLVSNLFVLPGSVAALFTSPITFVLLVVVLPGSFARSHIRGADCSKAEVSLDKQLLLFLAA